jgi:hypothetical protein
MPKVRGDRSAGSGLLLVLVLPMVVPVSHQAITRVTCVVFSDGMHTALCIPFCLWSFGSSRVLSLKSIYVYPMLSSIFSCVSSAPEQEGALSYPWLRVLAVPARMLGWRLAS